MLIFFLFIIEGIICFIIKDSIVDHEVVSLIIVLINSLIVIFYLSMRIKEKGYYILITIGYILRLIVLFLDIYGRGYFYIPHSGSDTEGFFAQGILISNDLSLFDKTNMGAYANLLGLFFYLFGDQRILAQYLNTLLGLGIIVIVYRILQQIEIENRTKKMVLCIIIFFPQAIIFSGILLRENLVSFGLIMMTYYLIKWYKKRGNGNIVFSILFFGIAVYFHSGVVVGFIPLAFMYTFYRHEHNSFKIDLRSILMLCLFIFVGVFLSVKYGDVIFNKFGNTDITSDDFYKGMSSDVDAGSRYLNGLTYNSFYDILLYSPLKMFYFLFSPIPLNWRGFMDIITFLLDSCVYLVISVNLYKYRKLLRTDKPLFIILIFLLLLIVFTFAFGTVAAGTAVRHRNKIMAVLLVTWAIVIDRKLKNKAETKIQTI